MSFNLKHTALLAAVGLAACNPLNKMSKEAESLTFDVTPKTLEVRGDSVEVTVSGKFPAEYFNKKATVVVNPVFMVDGEAVKTFDGMTFQGSATDQEGQVIDFEKGGSFSFTAKLPYSKEMERGELFAVAQGVYKGKEKEVAKVKLADGTITTPYLVQSDDRPILGEDNFVRITDASMNADIHFNINSSQVMSKELSDDDMKAIKQAIAERSKDTTYVFKGIKVEAYASPDGELTRNESLADNRATSASNAIMSILKRSRVEVTGAEGFTDLKGKGEDWAGFKSAMEASDIEDKNLIIRVLQMYNDPAKREEEIKNLAETYEEVAEQILPALRRAQLTLQMEKVGLSDEQISERAQNTPSTLTVEELLYAATLVEGEGDKMAIYKKAIEEYPEDWRGYNNVAYLLIKENNLTEAKTQLNKAESLASDNPVINNNLGVIARLSGDRAAASKFYEKANGAGNDVAYNQGIVAILDGDFEGAASKMSSEKTFNAALAKLLSGNAGAVDGIVSSSDDAESAMGYYLRAIAAARQSNQEGAMTNLKKAIQKEGSLKEKAMKDVEFANVDLSTL